MFNFFKKCECCKGKASTRDAGEKSIGIIQDLFTPKDAHLINKVCGKYGGYKTDNRGIGVLSIAFRDNKVRVCDKCIVEAGKIILSDESLFDKCKNCGVKILKGDSLHVGFCGFICRQRYGIDSIESVGNR